MSLLVKQGLARPVPGCVNQVSCSAVPCEIKEFYKAESESKLNVNGTTFR